MKGGKVFDKDDAERVIAALQRGAELGLAMPEPDLLDRIARAPLLLEIAARIQAVVPKPAEGAGWTLVLSGPPPPPRAGSAKENTPPAPLPDCPACDNTGWSRSASGRCSCPRGR